MRSVRILSVGGAVAAVMALTGLGASAPPSTAAPAFNVTLAPGLHAGPVTGRLLVIVSRSGKTEPREQADSGGVTDTPPMFGKDVGGLAAGNSIRVDDGSSVYGYPLQSLSALPAGDYWVQALLNVYTTFHRSNGSVVSLHLPCGDGNDLFVSPGNLVSQPMHVHVAPGSTVSLTLSRKLPQLQPVPPGGTCQQGNPPDTAHVKHIKIYSTLLSHFWGHPMYIGANVLLPQGYNANGSTRYPVIYSQTHFPTDNPLGFHENLDNAFSRWWVSGNAPGVIVVELRTENPYFDDSYAINSANLGPYGDAITRELMPAIDKNFRTVGATWARTITGGSTGGWEAVAQQVFYPKLYSGAWIFYPDPVDFRFLQLINVYSDPNAYYTKHPWLSVPRPSARTVPGDTLWTMAEENHWELALGTHGRSGLGQWDIWQAVYGPEGSDGYPAPIWNKRTGQIDHSVAQAWRYKDIHLYLQQSWPLVGPSLTGKLRFFVGDDDTFFLNNAVETLQPFMKQLQNPPANATFTYGHNKPHGWSPYTTRQLVTIMANYMKQHAPSGASTASP